MDYQWYYMILKTNKVKFQKITSLLYEIFNLCTTLPNFMNRFKTS